MEGGEVEAGACRRLLYLFISKDILYQSWQKAQLCAE